MRARSLARGLVGLGFIIAVAGLFLGRWAPPALAATLGLGAGLLLLLSPRERYGPFALRVALAVALLAGGHLLTGAPLLLVAALGVAWMAVGVALALGFLTPWSALVAAIAFLLLLPYGYLAPAGFAVAALGLALLDDDTLALDARLARRGGLFPSVRHEVVLERR
ncbi:MAG TPA: hypothetical protein VGR28_04385 [Candidatus Thermoplasmatota archaeon]|jgi:hypothetical protein|nr:hypothetical protein [Candidatus Thermoplasmatota archaeon]